ncbi:lasso peptide biosynthesis B2 protein [Sphingosinicella sp. YJ22]|uniref:lasso peptide biosynthesis B2 protein n=1 Tax=Sphingosinicella sp. YJ22 TaxID=1104780 RepID=UPI0014088265|nr:lasso peptide biosynthesis B2 protein [Sphingosinicella sp. YJ22]
MTSSAPPLRSSRARGIANRLLVLEAIVNLLPAALAVRFLSFARVVEGRRRVRRRRGGAEPRRLARMVEIARAKVPWRAKCFESALCLRAMLRRRGIPSTLHYGIGAANDGALNAHVWLSVGGEVLIGGENAAQFACVATFSNEAAD